MRIPGLALGLVAMVVAVAAPFAPAQDPAEPEAKPAAPAEAETPREVALDSPDGKAAVGFLDAFQAAAKAGQNMLEFVDGERMLFAARRIAGKAVDRYFRNREWLQEFRKGFFGELGSEFADIQWRRYHVQRVERLDAHTMRITFRVWLEDGDTDLMRWWLRAKEGAPHGHRLMDAGSVFLGLRTSGVMAGTLLSMFGRGHPDLEPGLELVEALKLFRAGQGREAAALAEPLDPEAFVGEFAGLRWLILTSDAVERGDYEATLGYMAEWRKLDQDAPIMDFLESQALVQADRDAEAEAPARAFLAATGPSAIAHWLVGNALRYQAGREPEAIAAFRAGDDLDDPGTDCFAELLTLLPDGAEELGTRYARVADAAERFQDFADLAWEEERYATVERLCDVLTKLAPDDPNVAYYRAIVWIKRDQRHADAAALLAEPLDRLSPEWWESYAREYCIAMRSAGKPLEAYARLERKPFAFEKLAPWLETNEDWATLEKLLAAHKANAPFDPWLRLYQGALHEGRKEWAEARRRYAEGERMVEEEDDRTEFRRRRVRAAFHAGDWEDAYLKIGPSRQVFRWLASLMLDHDQGEALVKLCEVHTKHDAGDEGVASWFAEGYFMLGRYAKAIEHARPLLTHEDEELWGYAERRIVLSAIELKDWPVAMEVAEGSTARDDDPYWELVVAGARGDATAAAPLMAKMVELGYEADTFWHAPHVAEALEKHPDWAELRRQYPHEDH
ncbi:MAG: tetratricopeptide repeat protein [Planctomycetota bacterium]